MSFERSLSELQIKKMTEGENGKLFSLLKADVMRGEVFPAVRKNELHFYYKGGCLYKFANGSFVRDKNYGKYAAETEGLSPYEAAKKQNENRFTSAKGASAERQVLDGLNRHTFDLNYTGNTVVLDIEVEFNGAVGRGKKCDMVLLNRQTEGIMFVEGKLFSDCRVNVAPSYTPAVIEQMRTYTAAIAEQWKTIIIQYARHVEIINRLFGTNYRVPRDLLEPAKLLVYETPEEQRCCMRAVNAALGENNVFWVKTGKTPSLDDIWAALEKSL